MSAECWRGAAHNTPKLIEALGRTVTRPVPAWLGNFRFWWRKGLDLSPKGLPQGLSSLIWDEALFLQQACPTVKFNTLFVQRYEPGESVASHRDPKNNLDATVIGLYGTFGSTTLTVDGVQHPQFPGDVWALPCTINGRRGPLHRVDWPNPIPPSVSTRFAIILNRLE